MTFNKKNPIQQEPRRYSRKAFKPLFAKSAVLLSFLFIFVFTCYGVSFAGVGALFDSEAPIEVTGDNVTYDSKKESYHATGSVVVVQAGTTLLADELFMNMKEGTARAVGNVYVTDAMGNTVEGEKLTANLKEDTAVIINGKLYFEEGTVSVYGSRLEKTGKLHYKGKDVKFTTCKCEKDETPAWHFASSSAKMKTDGYILAWNAFLKVKDRSILYTPVLVAPIGGGRKTGFLMPGLGSSSKQGNVVDNTFFWAISDSSDASFFLDYKSKRGIGKGLEYRYYRTAESFGELYLYHFKEDDLDRVREFRADDNNLDRPLSANDNRWQMKLKHNEKLPGGFKLKADINVISDDEYFIDFAKTGKEKSLESLESMISLSKNWDKYSLTAQTRIYDNLLIEDDDSVLQKIPEVTFKGSSQRILDSKFFFAFSSSFVNYERNDGEEGQRLDVRPRISLPLNPGGWFELTPSFGPRMTLYRVEDDTSGGRYRGRGLYDFTTDLTTTFVKNYKPELQGVKVLRHTIRPKITHTYIPDYKQSRLPSYDSIDRVEPANTVRYSLNSIVTGKLADSTKHEYLYMDIAQTYDIREDNGKSKRAAGDERPFSDVSGELILRPTSMLKVRGKGLYDPYEKWFESSDAQFSISNRREDSFSLSYRYLRGSTRYLEASALLNLTNTLYVKYHDRYNFIDDDVLERAITFGYGHQCWGVELALKKGIVDTLFLLTFTMKGLGEVFTSQTTLSGAGGS
ncbi:hypothetical protein MNBD_DELTA01-1415 [hydrothermal vent metagenome]|uniref:LPS-assembly protein LptD n=1 Tax=hydrothermal vent metagenome TaxID=652676 RepID=A0A3B0RFQ4_9ZZZZ